MIGAQILVREYNNYPEDFKSKLRTLMPGETVTVKINPSMWGTVKETQFASMDSTSPIAGRVNMITKKAATRWLPCPWSVNANGTIIQAGFLQGYNSVDNMPLWRDRFFINGEMIFKGDSPSDVEDFYAIQAHPELKPDKPNGRVWKFFIDNPEESADNSILKMTWRNSVQTKVIALTDDQLKRLALPEVYKRALLNKPTHSTPRAMRGYIAGLLSNDAGFATVDGLLKKLSEIEEIELISRALAVGKLICSETNLKRNDNQTLGSFVQPLNGNNDDKAIEIFALYKSNPEWKQDISAWLREDEKKTPTGARKASKIETLSE